MSKTTKWIQIKLQEKKTEKIDSPGNSMKTINECPAYCLRPPEVPGVCSPSNWTLNVSVQISVPQYSLSQRKSSCYQFFRWACLSLKRWRRLPGSQLLISMPLLSLCVCVLTPDLCVCLITGCTSWSRGLGGRGRFDVCLHGESTSCPVFPAHIREAVFGALC